MLAAYQVLRSLLAAVLGRDPGAAAAGQGGAAALR